MISPGPAFQESTGSCHENISSQLPDGLTVLARIEIVTILVHYQPSYNTSHTMKPSDPLLLANVTLHCGMYPAGKVDISQHLAIPGSPRVTILSLSPVQTLVHCVVKHSRPSDLKSSSSVNLPFALITEPATDPSYIAAVRLDAIDSILEVNHCDVHHFLQKKSIQDGVRLHHLLTKIGFFLLGF